MFFNMQNKYFLKLFTVYLIIIALIITIVLAVINRNLVNNESYERYTDNVMSYQAEKSALDNRINVALMLTNLLFESDELENYATDENDYDNVDFRNVVGVAYKISEYQTRFAYLGYKIFVTNFRNNLSIGAGRTCDLSELEEECRINSSGIETLFGNNIGDETAYEHCFSKDGNMIFSAKKTIGGKSDVYIIIYFEVQESGGFYASTPDGTDIMCVSEIKGGYNEDIIKHIRASRKSDRAASEDGMSAKRIRLSSFDGTVFFETVKQFDDVVAIGYYENERPDRQRGVILILTGLLSAVIISFLLASMTYRPLKRVSKLLELSPGGGNYGDELEDIIYKLGNLMDANSSMSNKLSVQNEFVRTKVLLDILNGCVWGKAAGTYAAEYDLEFVCDNASMFLIACNDVFIRENSYITNDFTKLINNIFTFVDDYLSDYGIKFIRAPLGGYKSVVILKNDRFSQELINDLYNKIIGGFGVSFVIILSDDYSSYEEMSTAFNRLAEVSSRSFAFNGKNVFRADEVITNSGQGICYSLEAETEIINQCIEGNRVKVLFLLKKLFQDNAQIFAQSGDNINTFNNAMLVTVRRILDILNESPEKVLEGCIDSLEGLVSVRSESEAHESLKRIFSHIVSFVEEKSSAAGQGPYDVILKYIDDNLSRDLSLVDISDKFGISVSHISKLLKDNYGITFKRYLNEQRVRRACRIMDENKLIKINELAEMVGFNSATSFIRVFQQYMDITPKQYADSRK
ncbi:MAG: helix-turn-helix transcriptional regulator [Clostridia bacterium]|nr:helix-turn-helix transcriptional regulator [Clostridia bacterium]